LSLSSAATSATVMNSSPHQSRTARTYRLDCQGSVAVWLERSELVGVAGVRRLLLLGSRAVCGGGRIGGGEGELGVDRGFAGVFGSVGVDAFGVVV
jgi:hypothetical protein